MAARLLLLATLVLTLTASQALGSGATTYSSYSSSSWSTTSWSTTSWIDYSYTSYGFEDNGKECGVNPTNVTGKTLTLYRPGMQCMGGRMSVSLEDEGHHPGLAGYIPDYVDRTCCPASHPFSIRFSYLANNQTADIICTGGSAAENADCIDYVPQKIAWDACVPYGYELPECPNQCKKLGINNINDWNYVTELALKDVCLGINSSYIPFNGNPLRCEAKQNTFWNSIDFNVRPTHCLERQARWLGNYNDMNQFQCFSGDNMNVDLYYQTNQWRHGDCAGYPGSANTNDALLRRICHIDQGGVLYRRPPWEESFPDNCAKWESDTSHYVQMAQGMAATVVWEGSSSVSGVAGGEDGSTRQCMDVIDAMMCAWTSPGMLFAPLCDSAYRVAVEHCGEKTLREIESMWCNNGLPYATFGPYSARRNFAPPLAAQPDDEMFLGERECVSFKSWIELVLPSCEARPRDNCYDSDSPEREPDYYEGSAEVGACELDRGTCCLNADEEYAYVGRIVERITAPCPDEVEPECINMLQKVYCAINCAPDSRGCNEFCPAYNDDIIDRCRNFFSTCAQTPEPWGSIIMWTDPTIELCFDGQHYSAAAGLTPQLVALGLVFACVVSLL